MRQLHRGLCLATVVVALAGCGRDSSSLPDFTGLARDAAPSVVNISTAPETRPARQDDDESGGEGSGPVPEWFDRFFGNGPPQRQPDRPALGSGFIISEDGYILTNRHVVDSRGSILVKLTDRRQMVARVVGSDEYSDIALLKVDAEDLPAVTVGKVEDLQVGSWVAAIGSPFGFETSVTAGIVSAKQRSLVDDQYVPFIQSDVAINPGNSGGPLFNLAGEVVGINAQIYSRNGGFQGVSFAIPIDVAMDVADQLREHGKVRRGWLGVQIQEVDLALAESFGMARPEGALISQILPGSPAEKAGFEAGDVVLEFDGKPVSTAARLPPLVGLVPPGREVTATILREGEQQTLDVTIGELDDQALAGADDSSAEEAVPEELGLTLRNLRDAEIAELGVSGGVRVEEVTGNGPGKRAGLQAGDVIVAVGARRVTSVSGLRKRLADADGPVALRVVRGGAALYLPLSPE